MVAAPAAASGLVPRARTIAGLPLVVLLLALGPAAGAGPAAGTGAAVDGGTAVDAGIVADAGPVATAPGTAPIRAPGPVVDEQRLAAVEAYLEEERVALGVPGMAAVLVSGGEPVLEVGLGTADDVGTPVTPTTPFLIASLSKSVTALAVARLVEDGAVDPDLPVTTYLPELAPGGDTVTVTDLLSHRAGPTTRDGLDSFSGGTGSTLEGNVERLADELRPSAFAYTNAGYDVLALLVERVSGRDYEEFLGAEVFGPLGMTASTTDPGVAQEAGLALGHYRWLALGYRPERPRMPDGMVGSFRMFSSARDLGLLLAAHLGEAPAFTAASWEWLHTGADTGSGSGYGGGLVVLPADPAADDPLLQREVLAHDGASLAYRSMMWMVPEDDLGFVVLANANDTTDEGQLVRVAYNVQRLLLGVPLAEREPPPDPLYRWGKQALALLVVVQVGLGLVALRAVRRRSGGGRWRRVDRVVVLLAGLVDVAAVMAFLVVVPALVDTPVRVVLQSPDLRLLATVAVLAAVLGVVRLVLLARSRPTRPRSSTAQAQPASSTPPGTSAVGS
ncbi:hypothetical protein GCM10023168_24860 [Fodinibacter luteus]|uniref:Beta-lactamase-related domain-containing protein n=1 Tax=Fodinibacter luteus TaxID=552064 RepID=A0ABP8KJN6_9MICO